MTWSKAKEAIKNSSKSSSVYVGCDSVRFKRDGKYYAKYCTVVILHVDSNKGAKIFENTVTMQDFGSLRQRLLTEVSFAVDAASDIESCVGDRYMEVHLDMNPDPSHKSNVAVKEAIGFVVGSGFEAKIKPHSFAATCAADHVVRH